MDLRVRDNILSITPYSPGKPLEELEREYGIRDSVKLASNENPLGPSPKAVSAMTQALKGLHRYPDGSGYYLVRKLAEKLKVSPENIILGNGSDEILSMLTQVFLDRGDEAIMPEPSFLMYDIVVRCAGAKPICVPLKDLAIDLAAMAKQVTDNTRMIFLTHPNNPTGTIITDGDFERFMADIPAQTMVVIDEAYIEFARAANRLDSLAYFREDRSLTILRTFSKAYGLAGLRIGYGIMPGEIAAVINRIRMPFNANTLAQAGAIGALEDRAYLEQSLRLVHDELDYMSKTLGELGVRCYPTQANFFLIDVGRDADVVFDQMLRRGVIVRSMVSYGYPEYIRVSVGLHEENVRFLGALREVI